MAAIGHAPAIVKADPMTGETTVAGVYVAGDAGTPLQSLAQAAASGARAAAFLNHALCDEDAAPALTYGANSSTDLSAGATVGTERGSRRRADQAVGR